MATDGDTCNYAGGKKLFFFGTYVFHPDAMFRLS